MPTTQKDIPVFATEDEERTFWGDHDSTDYIDWDAAESFVLPKLKSRLRPLKPMRGSDNKESASHGSTDDAIK